MTTLFSVVISLISNKDKEPELQGISASEMLAIITTIVLLVLSLLVIYIARIRNKRKGRK